jgi:hypothetical protein
MKYDFFIDKSLNVLFERFKGEITYQNFRDAIQKSYNHPDWQKDQNVLCDLREAALLLSSDEMRQVIKSFPPDDQAGKLAMLISRDLEFGMSRMFEIISEDTGIWKEYKIFREISEAKQWLGIENYTNPGIKWLI